MTQRPLVVHFGRMGDVVMLLPLVSALHARFGTPVDIVCSGHSTRPLLEGQPGVGTLYWIRSRKDPYWRTPEHWRLVRTLRARGPGPTWICDEGVDEGRRLVARAGIPPALVADERTCPRAAGEHVVERWRRFSAVMPAALEGDPRAQAELVAPQVPPMTVAAAHRDELERWLAAGGLADRPLILVQVGSRSTTRWGRAFERATNRKYWPEERWARAIDAVAALEPQAQILLAGVPNEARINDRILRHVSTDRARNVARDLPMTRLLALQARAAGMIAVDTGPAHSAAALGCPLVVLFGIEDPAVYTPRSPIGAVEILTGSMHGERSMLGIEPDEVVAAWTRLRNRTPGAAAGTRADYGVRRSTPSMYGCSAGGTATEPSSF